MESEFGGENEVAIEEYWKGPNYQVKEVQRLTRSFSRWLGKLPIFLSLPRRKRHPHKVQQIEKNIYTSPSLEDLIIESM